MSNQNEADKQALNDVIDAWAHEENAKASGEELALQPVEEPQPKTKLAQVLDAWAAENKNS